jgi:hypothetical protein
VQVAALARVMRNAVAGIEFEPAGDAHERGWSTAEERELYSIARAAPSARVIDSALRVCGLGAYLLLQAVIQSRVGAAKMLGNCKMFAARARDVDALDVHEAHEFGYRPRHAAAAFVT